ncbi:MAG: hypothetical protein ACRD28_09175 [Acidobacteriaceae bacterium]
MTLSDLVFYGMVLVQPTAAIPMFGVTEQLSNGYSVCTYLAAMLAMVITAISYGRMAAVYPVAGSAYTYVGKSINPYLGFLVGWSMLLQYVLVPMLVVVWISVALHSRYIGAPQIHGWAHLNPSICVVLAGFLSMSCMRAELARVRRLLSASRW